MPRTANNTDTSHLPPVTVNAVPDWLRVVRTDGTPEFGRKLEREHITSPTAAVDLLRPLAVREEQEVAWALLLNPAFEVRGIVEIGRGHIDSVPSHPREVMRVAVAWGAAYVIFAHNHVTPDNNPSPPDIMIAHRLIEAGELLGIPVVGSYVFGSDGSFTAIHPSNLGEVAKEAVDRWGRMRLTVEGHGDLVALSDKLNPDDDDDDTDTGFPAFIENLLGKKVAKEVMKDARKRELVDEDGKVTAKGKRAALGEDGAKVRVTHKGKLTVIEGAGKDGAK